MNIFKNNKAFWFGIGMLLVSNVLVATGQYLEGGLCLNLTIIAMIILVDKK